ncbi:MAG: hypothetical protein M1813_004669 [Trichoglossum hirsutum]|nr:MAG: hypothetical protein M1813_004669 [Trichoglossum hirsutum]
MRQLLHSIHLPTFLFLLFSCHSLPASASPPPAIHFNISRRGGAFPTTDLANLTFLAEQLAAAEAKFNLTHREIVGNEVVRKARKNVGGEREGLLMGEVGRLGGWFAELRVGEPEQVVEMDLDMLTADFFLLSTTSRKGRGFTDLYSRTFVPSDNFPFPNCCVPTDAITLPTINTPVPFSFALCRPPKSSLQTLLPSGSVLGLAPSKSLSQTKADGFLKQILDKGIVGNGLWSIMLIDGQTGVFSVGGTGVEAVKMVKQQTITALDKLGEIERLQRENDGEGKVDEGKIVKRDEDWKWTKVQGAAAGWWQILMQGVWIDGSKVLKNQPVVIDLNTPFILAPPTATKLFYSSISGSRPLPPPHSQFHTFPCLNPPALHFEFAGGFFPVMPGGGVGRERVGGRFSLGRVRPGSGYCVGAVVETGMGRGDGVEGVGPAAGRGKTAAGAAGVERAGNGLRGLWVVGEPFWRGVGGVFDVSSLSYLSTLPPLLTPPRPSHQTKEQRVGMKSF